MTVTTTRESLRDSLVDLRRALHREPETGLRLPRTQEKVLSALAGLPVEVSTGRALDSVTAVVRGGRPGPAVLLRADMDALPVAEETGHPFASAVPGVAHACGHDMHMAALVGAARLLAGERDSRHGDVVLMFQPGEEGYGGARLMLEEGVLEAAGQRVVAAYALHVVSALLPAGVAATRGGAVLAAADVLRISVTGTGGHGSAPHLARDPVSAACGMVTALQGLVAQRSDPFDPVTLNIGVFHAGTRHNIIPERAEFEVSLRSFSRGSITRVRDVIQRTVAGIADAHEVSVAVEHESIYPVTINDPVEVEFARGVARSVLGPERVVALPHPFAASEDFSLVLDEVPGAYLFLGACPRGTNPATAPVNHSGRAAFDDAVLPDAAAMLARLAERRLESVRQDASAPATA
jgi:hippurate hydrolase